MKESIIQKGKRRVETVLGRYVRFNSHYRPSGSYATVEDLKTSGAAGNGAFLHEVYPAHVSEFKITDAFSEVCSDYLRPPLAAQMPPTYVAVVPQARLFTDPLQSNVAVISADNRVVGQASSQYCGGSYSPDPKDNLIFQQRFFRRPMRLQGTVFSMLAGYAAMDYFFHWINDSLPKLKLLRESGLFDEVDWFLVPSFKYPYQRETLRALGIGEERVIDASVHRHIAADRIITASNPRVDAHIPVWVYAFYRNDFLRHYASDTTYPPYVYISRRDAKFRNITNEDEVLAMVRGYGFQDFQLTSMPFAEQAKLFASAKAIVSPHGAGLANLMFCREGTGVLEIFAGGYVKPTFHNLANKSGLDHHFLVFGPRSAAANTLDGVPLNIQVDLPALEAELVRVLPT